MVSRAALLMMPKKLHSCPQHLIVVLECVHGEDFLSTCVPSATRYEMEILPKTEIAVMLKCTSTC